MEDQGGEIQIGARTTFEESHLAVTGIGRRIVIGEDCMFSGDIDVRTGDSHALVDLRGNKLNPEQDVIINNHVWVASHCSILKGAQLGAGSIVATHSTVTRVFKEDNLLGGGSPASKLKEGISWTRQRFPSIPGN